MTSEKAVAHFEAVDLNQFNPGGSLHIATTSANAATTSVPTDPAIVVKVCNIYRTIRPYLLLVGLIPFVPAKVKTVITAAILELDKLCPGS